MGPVTERERVDVIDVLRGFALFGILAANMRAFNSPAEVYGAPLAMWTAGFDRFAQGLIETFISGKFITTFSVLFGLGFAIQMDRATARGAKFLSFYPRRLLVLLLLGLAHGILLWWGDILATYALLGFLLLPFRNRKQKTLLIWVVALQVLLLVVVAAFVVLARFGIHTPAPPDPTVESIQHSVRVFSQGAWLEIQRQRLNDWLGINSTVIFFGVMWVLPRFLFGLWLWRSGFLGDLPSRQAFLRKLFLWGTALGVAGNAVATVIVHIFDPRMSKPDLPGLIYQTISVVSVPLLSGGYAAGIALFTMSGACQWLHRAFAAIGRTALSNYLLQTVICTTLYYSYGFALFGKVGPAWGLAPTVLIYAVQLPLSLWWLRHYRFGPAEWLWRSLTYAKAQPFSA